jgi:hypothetical protein
VHSEENRIWASAQKVIENVIFASDLAKRNGRWNDTEDQKNELRDEKGAHIDCRPLRPQGHSRGFPVCRLIEGVDIDRDNRLRWTWVGGIGIRAESGRPWLARAVGKVVIGSCAVVEEVFNSATFSFRSGNRSTAATETSGVDLHWHGSVGSSR